jgi:hypothetical protein
MTAETHKVMERIGELLGRVRYLEYSRGFEAGKGDQVEATVCANRAELLLPPLRTAIESLQKDCRLCEHFHIDTEFTDDGKYFCLVMADTGCTNHDKFQPVLDFKQLTIKE